MERFETIAQKLGTTEEKIQERDRQISQHNDPDLSAVEGDVLDWARRFPGNDASSVGKLMRAVQAHLQEHPMANFDLAKKVYLRRTAHEILTSGKVSTYEPHLIRGCQDYAVVALALLRAKGIEADYLRHRIPEGGGASRYAPPNHSVVVAHIGNEHYRIDLCNGASPYRKISEDFLSKMALNSTKSKDAFSGGYRSVEDAFEKDEKD